MVLQGLNYPYLIRPVEYYNDLNGSVSDNFESMLESMNEIVHFLYYKFGEDLETQIMDTNINFELIHPYENDLFQEAERIAKLKERIVESLTKDYYLDCDVKGVKIDETSVHGEQELSEGSNPPYLGRVYRTGGGYPAFSAGKRKLLSQIPDDREGLCRCKREIWNALYALPGIEESQYVGKAEICCHEPEETGNVEAESRPPSVFCHNE